MTPRILEQKGTAPITMTKAQDHMLPEPPEVPRRARPPRPSQEECSHTQSSLWIQTAKRSTSHPTTPCNHSIQGNRVINSYLPKQGSTLVFDFYTFISITLSKLCSTPIHFQRTSLGVQTLETLLWVPTLLGDDNKRNHRQAPFIQTYEWMHR